MNGIISTFSRAAAGFSLALCASLFAWPVPAQVAAPPPAPGATAGAPSADSQPPPAQVGQTIKKESRLVLVDAVVTDKKGNYIHDLSQNDFKVYEDNKEQPVTSFSNGSNAASPQNPQKHYLVLFFDNASMAMPDQISARAAATKFIESNAAPDHLMAVVEFGGTLRIVQNFTANSELLEAAAKGIKSSYVASNTDPGGPNSSAVAGSALSAISSAEADYGARSMLLSVRTLAKNLRTIPGRKMLVLFSSGFPLTAERQSELTATIDACNKSNVAVYTLDVRGLQAGVPKIGASKASPNRTRVEQVSSQNSDQHRSFAKPRLYRLVLASYPDPQKPGGGGGTEIGRAHV